MVMTQSPNTQYVAHEFVRQYYTMLHKDPTQLHRFYTKESRLTHGVSPNAKSEEPVCGQEAIYEKIAALNFQNCHAKIRSIDSHPTIGGGVVIQVTGELSNSGMGMRKFMQTFVLAQQDPKKYNVFNDIFRYQDETFEDTENGEAVDGVNESENGYHDQSAQVHSEPTEEIVINSNDHADDEQNYSSYEDYKTEEQSEEDEEVEQVKENDVGYNNNNEELVDTYESKEYLEDTKSGEYEETVVQQDAAADNYYENQEDSTTAVAQTNHYEEAYVEDDNVNDEKPATVTPAEETTPVEQEEIPQEPVKPQVEEPPKPFTWAALAKKNTAPSVPPPQAAKPSIKKTPAAAAVKPQKRKEESPPVKKESPEDLRRRLGPPPDEHQIFIGNLPSGITEDEVREAFKEFGTIVEVRLNPKNFGFVAFSGTEAPQEILKKSKTITIRSQAINTEVKRSVSGANRGGGGTGGGGFRRGGGDKDSNRSRSDFKSNNRNQGRSTQGKSNTFPQKQTRNDDGKTDKKTTTDFKPSREQKPFRR